MAAMVAIRYDILS